MHSIFEGMNNIRLSSHEWFEFHTEIGFQILERSERCMQMISKLTLIYLMEKSNPIKNFLICFQNSELPVIDRLWSIFNKKKLLIIVILAIHTDSCLETIYYLFVRIFDLCVWRCGVTRVAHSICSSKFIHSSFATMVEWPRRYLWGFPRFHGSAEVSVAVSAIGIFRLNNLWNILCYRSLSNWTISLI